ncbi:hypothetical protein L5515_010287 [Caenorhabditis briggsae]|nr:hypothetical protein L5515_010287 [Caenorhabditis briggsae]
MISYIFLLLLLPISVYGQEDKDDICLKKFQEAKTCMDKLPLSKEIDKAPFSDEAKNEQFLDEMKQLRNCVPHDGCPVLNRFVSYFYETEMYAKYFTKTTCITPETLPKLLKTCNERPKPPSDRVEPHCDKYADRCLINKLKEQGQCSRLQMAYFGMMLQTAKIICELVEENREQWSHYFNLVDVKIDFPVM